MPPVSQRYRDARRRQILEAARRCFARSGFHGTAMQDVFAESGLSAGAVYGYFASKDELVAAIIEEVMTEISDAIAFLADAEPPPPPHEVVAAVIQTLDRPQHDRELARLAVQIWAETATNTELRSKLSGHYTQMQARFATLVQRYQHDGTLDPTLSAHDLAKVLTALGPAFLSQHALLDNVTADTFTRGLTGLLAKWPNPTS